MNPFPEEYELIALFEEEPIILDSDVPWYYNALFFKLSRNGFLLEVNIEPAINRMNIRLSCERQGSLFDIGFENINGIEIYRDLYSEGLLIILDEDDPMVTLRLETKPYIKLISTGEHNFRK